MKNIIILMVLLSTLIICKTSFCESNFIIAVGLNTGMYCEGDHDIYLGDNINPLNIHESYVLRIGKHYYKKLTVLQWKVLYKSLSDIL